MNQETIPVLDIEAAKGTARDLGEIEFENVPDDEIDLDGFHSSAHYANNVLPKLRKLAGFDDAGHGTFQVGRTVAVLDGDHDHEDLPIEAEAVDAHALVDEIYDAFVEGVYGG